MSLKERTQKPDTEPDVESTTDLKARIARITTSTYPVTAHNAAIIERACQELYARTGEVIVSGSFVAYPSCGHPDAAAHLPETE